MVLAHPSLGDPGDEVHFFPQGLFADGLTDDDTTLQGDEIIVRVPQAEIRTIFAHRQWRAGMIMADLINAGVIPLQERSVLELGAGTGLPSISACKFRQANAVVCTDYDSPSLIAVLKTNVLRNLEPQNTKRIRIAGHTWGKAIDDLQDLIPNGSFDVILLADCIWDDLSHAALVKSITFVLKRDPSSRVYMVSGLHTGREKIVSFLRRAHRADLQLFPFPQPRLDQWPALNDSEGHIMALESTQYASDIALRNASRYIMEMQLYPDKADELTTESKDKTRVWYAKTPRLKPHRRAFVIEERPEENKELNGVQIRNGWITLLALGWKDEEI